MKSKSARSVAILGISSSLLLVATLLPAASALELSLTSSVELEVPKSALVVEPGTTEFLFAEDDLTATASGAIFSTQLALVSAVSRQVELARTPIGAKKSCSKHLDGRIRLFRNTVQVLEPVVD